MHPSGWVIYFVTSTAYLRALYAVAGQSLADCLSVYVYVYVYMYIYIYTIRICMDITLSISPFTCVRVSSASEVLLFMDLFFYAHKSPPEETPRCLPDEACSKTNMMPRKTEAWKHTV